MAYCIYLRKSRKDMELEAHGELETLKRHEKILLNLAQKMNIGITKIYREVVSGESIDARPVMQELLNDVDDKLWEGVLVMEIERLARGDTIDQGIVARTFRTSETKIITPNKTYDLSNDSDEEYVEFGLFMSRREYKAISRRIQTGRLQSAREGRFLSSVPPYGYNKIKIQNDKGYTLEINPAEAETVKKIFEMYTNGLGMARIAAKLDELGIVPRNRDTWSRSTISDILQNPVYLGKIRWSYRKELKQYNGTSINKIRRVNQDYILVDGLHPPIISEEIFKKAQEVRKTNTYSQTKHSLVMQNPLSGLVYCKKCGKLMTRLGVGKNHKYATLLCSNRYCSNVSAPIFLIEEELIESLRMWLKNYKIKVEDNTPRNDSKLDETLLESLNENLKKVEMQISNTYDLVERGVYTLDIFTSRNKILDNRKKEIEKNIEDCKRRINMKKESEKYKKDIVPRIQGVLDSYFSIQDATARNMLLKTVLKKVEYLKETPNTRTGLRNANFKLYLYPKIPTD